MNAQKSSSSAWIVGQLEKALIWFQRIILFLLLVLALVRSQAQQALVFAAILLIHGFLYLAVSRIVLGRGIQDERDLSPRAAVLTLIDVALGSAAFYATGNVEGPAGILGFSVASIVAVRFGLWLSLAVSIGLWLIFTAPLLYNWLVLDIPAAEAPIIASFFVYLALTLILNYLASMEARQSRIGHDATDRLRRLTTIHEASRAITSCLEMDDVLNVVVAKATEILGSEAGALLLRDHETGDLVFHMVQGPLTNPRVGQRLNPGQGIAATVVEVGEGIRIDDLQANPRWAKAPDFPTGLQVRSLLCVPLFSQGQAIGALEAINKREGTSFDDEDMELLATFANQASIAVENARLYRETKGRLERFSTLYQISQSLASLDIDQVLSTIAEQTVSALQVDAVGVFLYETDPQGKVWAALKALHDPARVASDLIGTRFDVEEHPWLSERIREKGYSVFDCAEMDKILAGHSELRQTFLMLGLRTCLFVGLFLHGEPRGFLVIAQRQESRSFSDEEIQFCQSLAGQAVLAVENASLYERTDEALNRRLRELAAIEEIDHELGTSLDYDQILSLVLRRAVEACNASNGLIGTLSPDGQRLTVHFRYGEQPSPASEARSSEWPVKRGVIGRVVRSGQPALIGDVTADPDYVPVIPSTRSEIVIPIVRSAASQDEAAADEGQIIGVLNLESDDAEAFTTDDLHFIEHLADHAAIAMENARLFREEQRRAAALVTLNQVSAAVNSVLDPDEVLETIVESVIQVADCQKSAIFVLEEGRLSLKMSQGLSDSYVAAAQEIEVGPDSRAQVVLGDEPLVVTDIETDPRLAEFVPLARQEGFRAVADLPLRGREENLGELSVYYARPHEFTALELDVLKTFANQAAIAIENARLFYQERQRVQAMSAISDISREIRASLDLERTLHIILTRIRALVPYYIAEICLWNETEQVMVTWASAGDPRYTARTGGIYNLDEGFTGWIARKEQVLLVPDITARQDVQPKILDDTPLRSYIGLPLKIGQTFIGTLEMASEQINTYDEEDLEALQIIADQAAVAIQNARLYNETQQRYEQTQLLLRVSEVIGSTLNLTDTVRHVAREMCRALDADLAGVYLPNEAGTHLRAVAGYHIPKKQLELYRDFQVPIRGHRFIEEAWETRQAVYSVDPPNDPRIDRATIEAFPNETTLFAPMVAHDEVIGGVYLVWTKEKRNLSPEELRMANAIAWQAGTIVENARLFEAQQRRLRELSILFETSAAISSSLELDEVLNTVARQLARALNVATCSISDWNPQRGTVTTLVHQDLIPGLPPGDVGQSYALDEYPATAQVLHARQPRAVQLSDEEADLAEVTLLEQLGQKSLLMIPLVARDRVVGLVELYESRHVREFSADDIRLGQALANQAAIAIENARLYEQTDERLRARLDQITALQRTTQELNATLALDQILQVVLESAIQTTGATHGNVMLVDMETAKLAVRATEGYAAHELATIDQLLAQPDENGLVHQTFLSGQPRIVDDAHRESVSVCVRQDTRSALVVPIFYEKAVVGLINLRHTDVEAFDQEDLAFVQSLAEQAAVAIGNALRFEDQIRVNTTLRQRTEQMGRLLEVSQKLRADVALEDTLEEIAYAIQETVGFNTVLISISEGIPPRLRRVAAAGLPLHLFEEMKKVRQPLERYERIFREEYRQGLCYFFPFQKRGDWEADLHVLTSMAEPEDWEEGQWHAHDMLIAPLRGAGGRLLGHISVDEPRDGRRPGRQTLEALAIFANQAAIAIENTNLYADTQARADRLALINEVGRSLAQAMEPDRVRDIVVRAVTDLFQCETSTLFQFDPVAGKLVPVASQGVSLDELNDLRFAPGEGLVGQVAATAIPLVIPDTEREPRFVPGPVPVGSMLCAPMLAGQQVIGVLTAGSARKYGLAEADRVVFTTLADQAAVALESARLFASTQRAAVQLSLLNAIGRQAAGQLELAEMLDSTVNALHQRMGYHHVAVLLVEEDASELSIAAANKEFWSALPASYRQQIDGSVIGEAVSSGESVLANDALADPRSVQLGEWAAPATLSVPIKIANEPIGVLHVEANQRAAFGEEDVAALEIAADQLAVAIQNAHLFQERERRVAELATINEIGRAISGALDVEQLSELIYTQISNLLDTRNFHIGLFDADMELIRIEFLVERGQRQPPVELRMGQGLTSYLVSSGQPVLLTHGTEEFLREHGLTLERNPAKSWLGVPMLAEDRVIGAIAVQSFEREHVFDEGHLNLLATVAGQAAVAFQNATLFQEREKRINELSVLNEMAQAISSSLELGDLLEIVHAQVSRIFDTTNFYIATYQEGSTEWTLALAFEHSEREPLACYSVEAGITGYIIRTRNSVLLRSMEQNLAFHAEQGIDFVGPRAKSWMGVPLIAADQLVGVMAIQSYRRENLYDSQDLALFSTIAAETAAALRNAQLYQQIVDLNNELEDRVEARTHDLEEAMDELTLERDRVETLYRITSELGTTLELERVLQRALGLFADSLRVTHGTILLLDQESRCLDLRASLEPIDANVFGLNDEAGRGRDPTQFVCRTPLKPGVGLAGWTIEHREPALVADVTEDPRWIDIPGRELKVRSVVAAPLSLGGGDILGVLTLGHPQVDYFDREHLKLVTAAAAQIAMAVNNSDLYAFITDQADQLGSMLQSQQAESAKNQAVLESIADGVLVLDHNGRVLLINPAAEEMLGISAKALEGDHFRYILGMGETAFQRDLAQGLYSELRKRLETPQSDEAMLQASAIRLESGKRALAVNIAPLITTIGGTPGVVAALRDISREVEVERLKNEFISTVSHELRTPMTSIKGYTDLLFLGMAGGLSDAQRNFLQIIKSNADRLTALVNDILDISRIETGRIRLNIEALDLGEIISNVVLAFREQYRGKDIALGWEEPEGVPEVRGDRDRVTQILNNLVANAWQYTLGGGKVEISVQRLDNAVQVNVADTGIGISEENVNRIFDRFYRVSDPVVEEAGGTGLGLSIVKMFVDMLGGQIWVESEEGVGSTFSFTLPFATADAPDVVAEIVSSEPTAVVSRRPKILVVEDDRDLALLLRRQLELEGYQVLLAGSGEDALWLAREEQPQLITLDIMLPDVDGFSVLERLKEHPLTAPIPVVIASVLTEAEEGYSLGAVDYVVKPFSEDKLLKSIQAALSPPDDGQTHRVLVVDDDADIRGFLEEALSYHGYHISTAANGIEALEQVGKMNPDLILLDLKMPGLDGYEVIRRLKADAETYSIPIIVITASPVDQERDRVRVLGMGASQYVTKPLSIEALVHEIKKAIAERQAE